MGVFSLKSCFFFFSFLFVIKKIILYHLNASVNVTIISFSDILGFQKRNGQLCVYTL